MNFLRNNFANILTLGNLFSGCIGAVHLMNGNYHLTALCILASLGLDFLDGFVARALKANSNLGIQLDSLADMVSFGFIPGLAMYKMLEISTNTGIYEFWPWLKYLGFLITVFSCLRLAIFNIDEEQKYYFKGLNTPSNTILIFGMLYILLGSIHTELPYRSDFSWHPKPEILLLITLLSSWLLVSPIKMIAMKFKSLKIQDNIPKIVLLIGSIIIIAVFKTLGIPLVIVWYILVSVMFQKQLK